jgi:pyridoxamine 5'-phosphate oxidase family protein
MVKPIFSERETEYLKSQRLARIAAAAVTTSKQEKVEGSARPDVVPVGFDFDGNYLYVGGLNLLKSTKYKIF